MLRTARAVYYAKFAAYRRDRRNRTWWAVGYSNGQLSAWAAEGLNYLN